jgi:hypothetical protein
MGDPRPGKGEERRRGTAYFFCSVLYDNNALHCTPSGPLPPPYLRGPKGGRNRFRQGNGSCHFRSARKENGVSVRRRRRRSSVGAIPTRQLSLQPVAIEAVVEVTTSPEPSMERTGMQSREQAGRNAQ